MGAGLQWAPKKIGNGVFVNRAMIYVGVPTGKYSASRPVILGNHFVVVDPYYAFTYERKKRSGTLYVAAVAEVHARLGNSDEALKILSQLQASSEKYVSPHRVAFIYASLGELDQAFSWQEKAYEEHDASLVWVKVAAESDALRADMRFADLVRRMNFPGS